MGDAGESDDFTKEGEGLHTDHEWISQIGTNDLLEGVLGGTFFDFSVDLISTNENRSTVFELDFTNAIRDLGRLHCC